MGAVADASGKTGVRRDKLRVGFVSGDFYRHSVSYFLLPLFRAYDRTRLEFVCFSNARHKDEVTVELKNLVDGWRDIAGLDDEAAIAAIRGAEIDILMDLSGHTKDNRLEIFAAKSAPVQATWLGYPDTTGLSAVDYRLSDAVADPPGAERYCVERLYRLQDGFLCYSPPDMAETVSPPPMQKNGYVTFASFNNMAKTTPGLIAVWARILQEMPDSRLLLKNNSLACPTLRQRLAGYFARHGVAAERLILKCRSPTVAEHLAEYAGADITLDTFPYNGTTTTCEALWMGVPVIACRGDRHAARVGASILTQTGLQELLAEDVNGYVAKAVGLGGDGAAVARLRQGMRQRLQDSALFDEKGFAAKMAEAFFAMWREKPPL